MLSNLTTMTNVIIMAIPIHRPYKTDRLEGSIKRIKGTDTIIKPAGQDRLGQKAGWTGKHRLAESAWEFRIPELHYRHALLSLISW